MNFSKPLFPDIYSSEDTSKADDNVSQNCFTNPTFMRDQYISLARCPSTEMSMIKQKLRSKVPVLHKNEIRRNRSSLDEAIVQELFEGGYVTFANFIRRVFQYETTIPVIEGIDRISLVSWKPLFDLVLPDMRVIEELGRKGDIEKEIQNQLSLLKRMAEIIPSDLNWMLDMLFDMFYKHIKANNIDGGRFLAIYYIMYGEFLSRHLDEYRRGIDYLLLAKDIAARNTTTWLDFNNLGELYRAVCKSLAAIACEYVLELRGGFALKEAMKIANIAITAADESLDENLRLQSFIASAQCHMHLKENEAAEKHYIRASQLAKNLHRPEEFCISELGLAHIYVLMRQPVLCLHKIERLMAEAKANDLKEFEGHAWLIRGELDMVNSSANTAAEKLVKAVNLFSECDSQEMLRFARNLAAVAMTQQLMDVFYQTILKSEKAELHNNKYLLQLLEWKFSRKPFWQDTDGIFNVSVTDTTFSMDRKSIDEDILRISTQQPPRPSTSGLRRKAKEVITLREIVKVINTYCPVDPSQFYEGSRPDLVITPIRDTITEF